MSRILVCVVLAAAFTSATADAQTPAAPLAGLADRLSIGDTVTVTTETGTMHTGRLQGLSETALVLRTKSADLALAAPGILRIAKQEHHIQNGMLIGFASGFLIGAVLALRADDCTYTCFSSPAGMTLWGGLGGGAGMAVGAVVGAARPRESVVYERESRTSRMTISPQVGPGRAAVRIVW
jgi:hypothetical protein